MQLKFFGQLVQLSFRQTDIFGIGSSDRFPEQVPCPAHIVPTRSAILTLTASEIGVDHDTLADLKSPDALTQGSYFSRTIGAVNMRKLQLQTGPSIAHQNIHAVERGNAQTDQAFARFSLRIWEIGVFNDFRPPVLAEKDNFHDFA